VAVGHLDEVELIGRGHGHCAFGLDSLFTLILPGSVLIKSGGKAKARRHPAQL
jgi:hypothetical protein